MNATRANAAYAEPIAVKAEGDRVEVSIPTEGMTPEDVNEFISWLRVESIVRRRMAHQLAGS